MGDLTKRQFGGDTARLQADVERGLAGLRRNLDDLGAEGVAYSPADPDLWDPVPTTLQEAIDRIVRWLRDRHGDDMPIGE